MVSTRVATGAARHYCCVYGTLFVKRSSDPASNTIVKLRRTKGADVFTTGRSWIGSAGGVWAQLDTSTGEKKGWVLVQGPGFGYDGPLLSELPSQYSDDSGADNVEPPCVFALSDLHADYPENMALFENLPARPKDAILLAGDISHSMTIVRKTFELFLAKFRHVFFCPGNHDLWCHRGDGYADSLDKLRDLFALCRELGVITEPRAVGGILILPLLSWYDFDFDADPNVNDVSLPLVEDVMTDFALCKWPSGLSVHDGSVARHFDDLNGALPDVSKYNTIISFSHFLPRPDLLPEKRYLMYPHLPKAVGSVPLRDRVKSLRPSCHVFGHTHYGWSIDIDGVHYLQPAVAYPRERQARPFALTLNDSSASSGEDNGSVSRRSGVTTPVLVYNGISKELVRYKGFWSDYYKSHPRRPDNILWLYRSPRTQPQVFSALQKIVESGQLVDDEVIEGLIACGC